MQNIESDGKKQLKRDVKAAALRMFEDGCRTLDDFTELAAMYDKLDKNRERRVRYWERLHYDAFDEWHPGDSTVIPPPLEHEWWIALLNGNFIDVIFDCPHELRELTGSRNVSELLGGLDENRKEILYYLVIRQWSPQKLAAFRNQTDRNIRKVYNKMIGDIRAAMFERLKGRYFANESLTYQQREFCKNYNFRLSDSQNREIEPENVPQNPDFKFKDYDVDFDKLQFTDRDELYYDTFHFYDDYEDYDDEIE